MSSNTALLLCVLFILLVLIIDWRQKSYFTPALSVPWIWLIFSASKALSQWLNPVASPEIDVTTIDYTAGNATDRLFLLVLLVLGIMILLRRRLNWTEIIRQNLWIFIIYFYMGFSIIWSGYPSVSMKRWIRAIGDLIMVIVILTEDQPFEAIKSLFRKTTFILLPLSVLLIKYFRYIGAQFTYEGIEMWVGVTTHKNSLGELSLIVSLFLLLDIISPNSGKRRYLYIFFLIISQYLLYGAHSMTSVVTFVIGVIIIIVLSAVKNKLHSLQSIFYFMPIIFIGFQLAFVLQLSKSAKSSIFSMLGRDMTLTGRTELWQELLIIGSKHPIFGVGYGGFWIGDIHNLWSIFLWRPMLGHNGYIDVYLDLGIIGVIFLLLIIIKSYSKLVKTLIDDFEYGRMRFIFLIVIIIHDITESSFARPTQFFWVVFLLTALNIAPKKNMLTAESLEETVIHSNA